MPVPQSIHYSPLPLHGKAIRTMTIFPGEVREPIRCTLRVVDLDDRPRYDALSYTWGEPGITESIEVDDVEVSVTLNLERALRHLRSSSENTELWVDAICINQGSIEEKSQQVALMGEIYRQCRQVRIWLGCDASKCLLGLPVRRVDSAMEKPARDQDPFALIRHLAGDRHIHEWACFKASSDDDTTEFEENEDFVNMWAGFITVSQSTWWSRMWTVQEAILPKAGTVTYDTWSTSLEDITRCGTNYYDHAWDCCKQAIASLPKEAGISFDEICTTFFTLHRDRSTLATDEYFDIQDQHISYGRRQCQNPRDKVYGLLALVGDISDVDLWLKPKYAASTDEVFYDGTRAMLYRDNSDLKCLTGTEYGPGVDKWASWVRDFAAPFTQLGADIASNRLVIYDLFDASKGRKAYVQSFHTWPQLADEEPYQVGLGVTGKCVGTITTVFQEMAGDDSQRRSTFQRWAEASSKMGLDPSVAALRFWRTLLGGVTSTGAGEAQASDWQRFTRGAMDWRKPFLSWVEIGQLELDFALDRTLLVSTYGRSYFHTQNGGQGLCYPKAQVGDKVWVVNGSKVPFILRHVHLNDDECQKLRPMDAYEFDGQGWFGLKQDFEPGTTPDGYYQLIGDCYFDCYMDGEAMDDANLLDKFIVLV